MGMRGGASSNVANLATSLQYLMTFQTLYFCLKSDKFSNIFLRLKLFMATCESLSQSAVSSSVRRQMTNIKPNCRGDLFSVFIKCDASIFPEESPGRFLLRLLEKNSFI